MDAPDGGDVLFCGPEPYDAGRLRRTLYMAGRFGVVTLPHGWTVDPALARPVLQEELDPVLADLAALRTRDRWPNETYPERVATLSLWLRGFPHWPEEGQLGAAWAVIALGMKDHQFVPRRKHAGFVAQPPADLFDRYPTVPAFVSLLRVRYFDTQRSHQQWLLERLAQRRRQHEAAALERALRLRQSRASDPRYEPPRKHDR
jgi:hypothetical protein